MTKRKVFEPIDCAVCGAAFVPKRKDSKCHPRPMPCAATSRKRKSRAASPRGIFRSAALSHYGERCMHCPKDANKKRLYVLPGADLSLSADFSLSEALVLCRRHMRKETQDRAYCRWGSRSRPWRQRPEIVEIREESIVIRMAPHQDETGGRCRLAYVDVYFADEPEARHSGLREAA